MPQRRSDRQLVDFIPDRVRRVGPSGVVSGGSRRAYVGEGHLFRDRPSDAKTLGDLLRSGAVHFGKAAFKAAARKAMDWYSEARDARRDADESRALAIRAQDHAQAALVASNERAGAILNQRNAEALQHQAAVRDLMGGYGTEINRLQARVRDAVRQGALNLRDAVVSIPKRLMLERSPDERDLTAMAVDHAHAAAEHASASEHRATIAEAAASIAAHEAATMPSRVLTAKELNSLRGRRFRGLNTSSAQARKEFSKTLRRGAYAVRKARSEKRRAAKLTPAIVARVIQRDQVRGTINI